VQSRMTKSKTVFLTRFGSQTERKLGESSGVGVSVGDGTGGISVDNELVAVVVAVAVEVVL